MKFAEELYHMAEKKSRGSDRTRNWSVIVYPESAPENWREYLDDLHLEWIESPLHEFDVNADGEVKKAHWHVLILFGGVKSYEQASEVVKPLNGSIPQRCHNAKAQVRYFAHLDNPEKYQYSVSDIRPHGGVDLSEMLRPSSSERYTLIGEMMEWVKLNGVTEFADLIDFALVEHPDDWLPLLCDSCAIIMSTYITSCRYRAEARRQQKTAAPPTQQANNQGQ